MRFSDLKGLKAVAAACVLCASVGLSHAQQNVTPISSFLGKKSGDSEEVKSKPVAPADKDVPDWLRDSERLTAMLGRPPTWFRPGTAYYDDVGVDIVQQLGEQPLGFSVNGDSGARASAARVRANLLSATPGSIVIAHMNHPNSGTHAGVADAIPQMQGAGWQFVTP